LNPDGRARVRLVRATRSDLTSTSTSAPRLPDHASAARNRAAAEFARRVAISRRARASRMARAHESESATTSALSPTRYAHEERVLRTPHDVEAWCDYLDAIDAGDENDDDDDASRAIDRYIITHTRINCGTGTSPSARDAIEARDSTTPRERRRARASNAR
jgi:hypothetical protein